MDGMSLSRALFEQYGSLILQRAAPEVRLRAAFGLVGEGSECFGFDDDISRDHDWGAGFCIWLPEGDWIKYGDQLQGIYCEILPDEFLGQPVKKTGLALERTGVCSIEAFYRRFIGMPRAPQSAMEWLAIPETYFAVATNGEVFSDPLGAFSRLRGTLLDFYPEEVRIKKIAARCFELGQAGQYNLPRLIKRQEITASVTALGRFLEAAASVIHLLNRRYVPFYKWSDRSMRELPLAGAVISQKLRIIATSTEPDEVIQAVEETAKIIIELLQIQNLTDSSSTFLCDHAYAIANHITDGGTEGPKSYAGLTEKIKGKN